MTTLKIQWNFGNECNNACEYCPPILRSGGSPFPDYPKLLKAFNLISSKTLHFNTVDLEITGGEPTFSESLRKIIKDYQDERIQYNLVSNGYANLEWWADVKNKISSIQLSYHSQTPLSHYQDVADILKNNNLTLLIPLVPEDWNEKVKIYNDFKNQGFITQLQLLYSNFTKGNNNYFKYTQEQWDFYYSEQGLSETDSVEETIEFKRQKNLNDYYGHLCWAGLDQIAITSNGSILRGWCSPGQILGNVYQDKFELFDAARVCSKSQCTNGFDLKARKSEGSWGMA